jgi:hypothetical protein
MTDKLKELVAKHVKTVREFVEHSQDSGDPGGGCQRCWDLFARVTKEADELEALLAEQSPAGEWDARALAKAWLEHAHGEEPCEVPGGQSEDSDVDCLAFQFRKAYAAGRSSQPAEPRDPAGK